MGKQRRQRHKFHTSSAESNSKNVSSDTFTMDTSLPFSLTPSSNPFENISIDFSSLKKSLNDDTRSLKSFKSLKSEKSGDKQITKKEKIKLRREFLQRKIDTVNQMKKELKLKNKRKNNSVIGDTNPLHDALPSLESLIKNKTKESPMESKKKRGIQKALIRKKNHVQGVQIFKTIMANKKFKEDPLKAISEHVKAVVEQERFAKKKKV